MNWKLFEKKRLLPNIRVLNISAFAWSGWKFHENLSQDSQFACRDLK
jgi:hypothetical protein